jgi:hypothetical protein
VAGRVGRAGQPLASRRSVPQSATRRGDHLAPGSGLGHRPQDSFEIVGDLPPGLDYHRDGTWTGQATEEGTSFFRTYYCDLDDWCYERLAITVRVVPAGAPTPAGPAAVPPAARPAEPTAGRAAYTG